MIHIGYTIEIRCLIIVDSRVLDYVTPSALAREGLLFENTRVYELDHVISIFYAIYAKCGSKYLLLGYDRPRGQKFTYSLFSVNFCDPVVNKNRLAYRSRLR